MIEKILIYISDSCNPYKNLATESYLFDNVSDNECILYLWQNENTIVIGRNQNPWAECNIEEMKKDNVLLARRLSGGGAVFHDMGNLNFTFIAKQDNYNLEKQLEVIKKACNLAGINAEISGRNDILADGRKFSGNAFYNSKGTSYHHGTILINSNKEKLQKYLTPNELKLKTKGIRSVKSRVINLCEINSLLTCEKMKEYMSEAFCDVYNLKASFIEEIPKEKIADNENLYGDNSYTYGKSAPFTFSCEGFFSRGSIKLLLNVEKGIITEVECYTDSMDWTLSESLKKTLLNSPFEKQSIINTLSNTNIPQSDDIIKLIEKQKI